MRNRKINIEEVIKTALKSTKKKIDDEEVSELEKKTGVSQGHLKGCVKINIIDNCISLEVLEKKKGEKIEYRTFDGEISPMIRESEKEYTSRIQTIIGGYVTQLIGENIMVHNYTKYKRE